MIKGIVKIFFQAIDWPVNFDYNEIDRPVNFLYYRKSGWYIRLGNAKNDFELHIF